MSFAVLDSQLGKVVTDAARGSAGSFEADGAPRWVDYWDGRSSLIPNKITSTHPADFRDSGQNADPAVARAATRLQAAFAAGDAVGAAALMSPDVVCEDMAAHTRIRGQL